jgi:transcriptional regulator with XRE-family HTH domain
MKSDEINPVNSSTGRRVKDIRLTLKMIQAEFSPKLGISIPTLSAIETDRGSLTLDHFVKLVKDFDVNPDYLIFGDSPMFRDSSRNTNYSGLDNLDVSPGTVRRFLHYFKHSSIMQLFIMHEFEKKLMSDQEMMDKQIEAKHII